MAAQTNIAKSASLLIVLSLVLSACGGGAPTETLPNLTQSQSVSYNGPAASTTDIQLFKLNIWDNLVAENRCGSCHGIAGAGSPYFVRDDDINLAYALANPLVDLASPADSRLVTKVAGGHNCWLSSDAACGAVITAFIENWAGNSLNNAGKQIQLNAPMIKDPGASKNFPADENTFSALINGISIHKLLTDNCAGCHSEASATPQAPFFANSDVATAYEAAKSKIDLDNPANSRLVLRLRNEFHNCWTSSCGDDANSMESAIFDFAAQITATQIDPQFVVSKALQLTDGIIASGGSRVENNIIALYEFKTGQGNTAFDTSGVEPAMDLTISGNVGWVGGWGIEIIDGKAQATTTTSKKLHDLIKSTGEYTIEAWLVPANVTQEGPARIIGYSAGTQSRNFTLGQTQYNYNFLNRSSQTDANGDPALSTADADEDLQATQQYVVATFDPVNGRRLYVNAQFTDDVDSIPGGSLADWDDSFAFVLGNEVSNDRLWQGKLRMVAIHNRALTQAQIQQNFDVGVGEKFFLLFGISHLVNVADAFIMFEVSQFDDFSYLFADPTFISLDNNAQPDGINIQAMRIGINGKEAVVGQAYKNLNTTVTNTSYSSESGQRLSDIGTIIALEKGATSDEFFLTFEQLGSHSNVVTEPTPLQPAPPPDSIASDIGLRTFEEIDATMSAVTGVSRTSSGVRNVFNTIKQQLPSNENISGFLSSHQMAISQLAIEYCNTLIDDNTLRTNLFPTFNFNADANTITSSNWDNLIITPLVNNFMGASLASQPTATAVTAEISTLLTSTTDIKPIGAPDGVPDGLARCGGPCPAGRAGTVVKAACSAVLGSAVVLLQ